MKRLVLLIIIELQIIALTILITLYAIRTENRFREIDARHLNLVKKVYENEHD